jgi:hypothetical protein
MEEHAGVLGRVIARLLETREATGAVAERQAL